MLYFFNGIETVLKLVWFDSCWLNDKHQQIIIFRRYFRYYSRSHNSVPVDRKKLNKTEKKKFFLFFQKYICLHIFHIHIHIHFY